jgi:hypothetical protein
MTLFCSKTSTFSARKCRYFRAETICRHRSTIRAHIDHARMHRSSTSTAHANRLCMHRLGSSPLKISAAGGRDHPCPYIYIYICMYVCMYRHAAGACRLQTGVPADKRDGWMEGGVCGGGREGGREGCVWGREGAREGEAVILITNDTNLRPRRLLASQGRRHAGPLCPSCHLPRWRWWRRLRSSRCAGDGARSLVPPSSVGVAFFCNPLGDTSVAP